MSKRLANIRLLLWAQEQMQANAQRTVAQASNQLTQLRLKEEALVKLMSKGDPVLINSLMKTATGQLQQIAQNKAEMDEAIRLLQTQIRKQGMSIQLVKRVLAVAEEEDRRAREKREHLELVELTAQRGNSL